MCLHVCTHASGSQKLAQAASGHHLIWDKDKITFTIQLEQPISFKDPAIYLPGPGVPDACHISPRLQRVLGSELC